MHFSPLKHFRLPAFATGFGKPYIPRTNPKNEINLQAMGEKAFIEKYKDGKDGIAICSWGIPAQKIEFEIYTKNYVNGQHVEVARVEAMDSGVESWKSVRSWLIDSPISFGFYHASSRNLSQVR